MRFGRGAALLAAAVLAGGLAGCGGGDEPTEPSTTVSPRTPVGQGKTSDATSDASGSESSSESAGETASSSSGAGGASSNAAGGAGGLPDGMPAVAKRRTEQGAAAFGKSYQHLVGEAAKTGDVNKIDTLGLKSCPPCTEMVKSVRSDAEKGRVRSTNPYEVSQVSAEKRPDVGYKVSMHVDVAAHEAYDDGKVYGEIDATSYKLTEHIVWRDGRWWVADWAVS